MSDPTFLFRPKDYGPAIELALNGKCGSEFELTDYWYDEDDEAFVVMGFDNRMGFETTLDGKFVRNCHKAVLAGVKAWYDPEKI